MQHGNLQWKDQELKDPFLSVTLRMNKAYHASSFAGPQVQVNHQAHHLLHSPLPLFPSLFLSPTPLPLLPLPLFPLVFAGSVLWTEKIHRTELNRTVVRSIFWLWLPKFGVILVAGCLISKIIQNRSKTGWNRLQLVKRSRALHSLVTTFITFNLIFGSSKTVKNWERYNEIYFGICTFFVQLVPEWL